MSRNRVLKVVVLASSLILVGAYVGYRVVSARETREAEPPAAAPALSLDPPPHVGGELMSGSKSMVIGPIPPQQTEQSAEMLYGSKSAPMLDPKDWKAPEGSK